MKTKIFLPCQPNLVYVNLDLGTFVTERRLIFIYYTIELKRQKNHGLFIRRLCGNILIIF